MAILEFQGEHRWLSNFIPCCVVYEGSVFTTVEHAFQAAKTLNLDERDRIRRCETPGRAKRMGKTVTLREGWELIKISVMRELLRQKFSQEYFKTMLLATGDQEIVEGNNWGDTYWGVCNGKGDNHLGKMIMQVREEIRTPLK